MDPHYLITEPSGEDPLGIARVSGFYGIGTWSGWLLTIITSWYTIVNKPQSRSVHDVVMHLLATNWAAIDLVRQNDLAKHQADASEGAKYQGAIAAASVITYWGLLTAITQFLLCLADPNGIIPNRAILLVGGSLLPSLSLAMLLLSMKPMLDASSPGTWEATLPAFYWPGMSPMLHGLLLRGVALTGLYCACCVSIICIALLQKRGRQISDYRYRAFTRRGYHETRSWLEDALVIGFGIACILFTVATAGTNIFSYIIIPICFIVFLYITALLPPVFVAAALFLSLWDAIFGKGSAETTSCIIIPCAPQRIAEWDQAFALFAGLVLFAIEVGPEVKRWLKRKTRRPAIEDQPAEIGDDPV